MGQKSRWYKNYEKENIMPIRPQDQNPDHPTASREKEHKVQDSRHYGKNAKFNPKSEKTDEEEYKSGGLPKMSQYSVDKQQK
jgi:hypothetical protein